MTTAIQTSRLREVLREIAADMKGDAHEFEGKPFTGGNVSVYLGNLGAAVAALADIVAVLLPDEEQERDPVAYRDYLPDLPMPTDVKAGA